MDNMSFNPEPTATAPLAKKDHESTKSEIAKKRFSLSF